MLKKIVLFILATTLAIPAYAKNIQGVWHNDLRTLFSKNNAIIYTINIRTFNAKDKNGNDIIDNNEESGNFINAIDELDNLKKMGINTIHVLPITPVGKIKAFGTAGSLYAMDSLTEINPQLLSPNSHKSGKEQAKRFIQECHKRNIRVIIDLPSCGSYDLFMKNPEYFIKDEQNNPVVPMDWTDVRLFNTKNSDIMALHKQFIDMAIDIGADGIRADVARLKTGQFWEKLIKYARKKDSEFLFLAEASPLWTEPISQYAENTSNKDLFDAGFDGYLGSFIDFKNIKTAKEFIAMIQTDNKLFSKYSEPKATIGSFSTHDEISPILIHGSNFSKMIIWLNTLLPVNSYYVDGFATGDLYNYAWANKPANNSQTDDEYYFTHNGQIDIFNFSRKPGGKDNSIYEEFVMANKFKNYYSSDLASAKLKFLATSNPKVFAFARCINNKTIIAIGNLDFDNKQQATIKVHKFSPNKRILNLRVQKELNNEYTKGKIKTTLEKGDIQVLLIYNMVL